MASLQDEERGANGTDAAEMRSAKVGTGKNARTEDADESASFTSRQFIDPPLYLGAMLLRRGQAKEALKLLTEANRIDSSCPVVTAQLGSADDRGRGEPASRCGL